MQWRVQRVVEEVGHRALRALRARASRRIVADPEHHAQRAPQSDPEAQAGVTCVAPDFKVKNLGHPSRPGHTLI